MMRHPARPAAASSADVAKPVSSGSGWRAVTAHTMSSTHTTPAAVTAISASSHAFWSHPTVPLSSG